MSEPAHRLIHVQKEEDSASPTPTAEMQAGLNAAPIAHLSPISPEASISTIRKHLAIKPVTSVATESATKGTTCAETTRWAAGMTRTAAPASTARETWPSPIAQISTNAATPQMGNFSVPNIATRTLFAPIQLGVLPAPVSRAIKISPAGRAVWTGMNAVMEETAVGVRPPVGTRLAVLSAHAISVSLGARRPAAQILTSVLTHP